jgi:hypothetical protein
MTGNNTKQANPSPFSSTPLYYQIPDTNPHHSRANNQSLEVGSHTPNTQNAQMLSLKPDDLSYFGALLQQVDEKELSLTEQKERKIMMLLLKVKNGTPPMRKSALR